MDTARIEVRLRDLAQLFNSLDPSPFIDRDLDAAAEGFIVGWARELPPRAEFELVVHLATPPGPERAAGAEEAVRHYFASRATVHRRELRQLLRRGRTSLVIGLAFLAVCFVLGLLLLALLPGRWGEFAELGVQIVGWVAMWRPLEIFLYDWWPVRADMRLAERLARMKVSLRVGEGA
jgi:hypothetical protein